MSLRPIAARWFELVTSRNELPRVMECLSRTGAVELEARSSTTDPLLFPGLDEELKSHSELARRYRLYWPPASSADRHRSATLNETLRSARASVAKWIEAADPLIAAIERLSQEAVDLGRLHGALQCAGREFPDIQLLSHAGPKLQARLLALPAGAPLREVPALVLFKQWQTAEANYAVVVGRPSDIATIEAQLPGLKGHIVPLPRRLPASAAAAASVIEQQRTEQEGQRVALMARLTALSDSLQLAAALGDIALIEWLNEHSKDLRGSEHLAWVTGWTNDANGAALRRVLDACSARYVLRVAEAPAGTNAPMVLSNPAWARAFEVFARMLGTPGRYESDPSQLLAIIASSIFGFMFGDVGQGAVICLAGMLLGRRIPMTRMLIPGGLMAIVFGVLFGSVFCREDLIPALWTRPMADPITILLAAIVAGAAVIALGLLLDALQMHWRGEGLHWWAHRAGLPAAYAGLLIAPLRPNSLVLAALGAAWYVIGAAALASKERLTALLGAMAELTEQTLRLLVNTLSFARIGAFALAHAGLSFAILELAEASGHLGYWIVLAFGNVLIIVLEGVAVSIQTTRLLLFEFFIRFLTGEGREFRPLPPPTLAATAAPQPDLRGTA